MIGVLNAVRQSGTHASFSVFDCDEYIERKLLSCATHTRSRQGGRVGGYCRRGIFFKREQNVFAIILYGHFFGDRSVQEERAKRIPTAFAHLSFRAVPLFFLLFFIKSARKLLVEPPMTVDLSLIAVAVTLDLCC